MPRSFAVGIERLLCLVGPCPQSVCLKRPVKQFRRFAGSIYPGIGTNELGACDVVGIEVYRELLRTMRVGEKDTLASGRLAERFKLHVAT